MNKKTELRKNKKESSLLSNCRFLLKTAFSLNPRLFAARIPLIIVRAATPFIPIFMMRLILNEIVEGRNMERLVEYVAAFALLTLAGNILTGLLESRSDIQMRITLKRMEHYLGLAVMKMPYALTEQPKVRDFVQLASEGNELSQIFGYVGDIVTGAVTLIGLTAVIAGLEPLIFLLVLAVVAVRLWTDKRGRKLWDKWRPRYAPVMRKIHYMFVTMSGLEYGKEIRLNHLEDWMYNKTESISQDYLKHTIMHNQDLQKNNVFAELSVLLQECAVYILLATKVVFDGMAIGDFSMYMTSINTFSGKIRGMVGSVSGLLQCGLFARDYRYCIENQNEGQCVTAVAGNRVDVQDDEAIQRTSGIKRRKVRAEKAERTNKPERIHKPCYSSIELEFKDVSFRYPQKEQMVLEHVSLTLKQGESLSIVGANGAGKTTFIKLLCRLYEPTEGEILLNGININKIPYDKYMRMLGVVFQDFKLFSFSMGENITMGLSAGDKKVEECVERSGLARKMASLPKGLETNISKEFDSEGVEFSGGEGQKLALARVLYKNAPVIILDEPTAAMDPLAEYELYSRFHELVTGKCAIYVSHRMSSTRFTDRIAVFDKGRMVEYGNHEELMNHEDGVYKAMFQMQAQYYV